MKHECLSPTLPVPSLCLSGGKPPPTPARGEREEQRLPPPGGEDGRTEKHRRRCEGGKEGRKGESKGGPLFQREAADKVHKIFQTFWGRRGNTQGRGREGQMRAGGETQALGTGTEAGTHLTSPSPRLPSPPRFSEMAKILQKKQALMKDRHWGQTGGAGKRGNGPQPPPCLQTDKQITPGSPPQKKLDKFSRKSWTELFSKSPKQTNKPAEL